MNNDLISREALKKAVESLVVGGAEGLKDYYENGSKSDENAWIGGVYDVWELINNAETVECCTGEELHEKCDRAFENGFGRGYNNGYERGKVERPHGKWIYGGSEGDQCNYHLWYECNQCKATSRKKSNFCPNCGAKMDGGDEEDEQTTN